MSSPSGRALGAAALTIALAVAACAGDSDPARGPGPPASTAPGAAPPVVTTTTAPASAPIEVGLSSGSVVGGPRKATVERGDEVRIVATSDVAEELHVHTYDRRVELRPGQPGEVRFTATIPGRHEVEFERSRKVALTLEVR